jgi:hypothetical protein
MALLMASSEVMPICYPDVGVADPGGAVIEDGELTDAVRAASELGADAMADLIVAMARAALLAAAPH